MAIKVCDHGEKLLLKWAMKSNGSLEDFELRLFKNDHTPSNDDASDASDYTEATFTGYAPVTLTRAGWNDPTTNGTTGKAEITYSSAASWTAGSTETIYGYYLVTSTSEELVFAEKFGSARDLTSSDTLTFTPKLSLSSES